MRGCTGYQQIQRFRQPLIWVVVAGVAALFWYLLIRQVVLGDPAGDRPAGDGGLLLSWVFFGVGLPLLFGALTLITTVDRDGLTIRFWPFPGRRIPWKEVVAARAITYRPLREFGGWGLRFGTGRRAYTVSGNRGVELTLTDGRRIVIDSRDPAGLQAALEQYRIGGNSPPV